MPRAESPPAQSAACPSGCRPASRGSHRKKSETNSLSSSSRACGTLWRGGIVAHYQDNAAIWGTEGTPTCSPPKARQTSQPHMQSSGHLGLAVFSITTGQKKGVILLLLSLIIPGSHKFIGLHHMSEDRVRGPGCVNDNSALVTWALNPTLNPI